LDEFIQRKYLPFIPQASSQTNKAGLALVIVMSYSFAVAAETFSI